MRRAIGLAVVALAITFTVGGADGAFGPVGGQDQRISFMGPEGDATYVGENPSVAYNASADEYLVVWASDDNRAWTMSPMSPSPKDVGELEIFGQRLSATGAPLGPRFRISEQGPDGNENWDARDPAVAYDAAANEYLVVWQGSTGAAAEWEIWAQRLSATGTEVGGNDFQVSHMGPDGSLSFSALSPQVAANPTDNEYLVVWYGDDNTPPLVEGELEVFGQRLSGTGQPQDGRIRISEQGADGEVMSIANDPSVAYQPLAHEYLVAWWGNVGTTSEYEIWGRRLTAEGVEIGGRDDLQISDMGPDGNASYRGQNPSVAAAGTTLSEYLIVWEGDDDTPPLVDNEMEVFGQRLSAENGSQTGTNDFRISVQGADGNTQAHASDPSVAYDPAATEYLVSWVGNVGVTDELEIWGRRLSAAGDRLGGSDDLQISHAGPPGHGETDAFGPRVAANPNAGEFLVIWEGDDVDEEFEIYGHRLTLPIPTLTTTNPPGAGNDNNPRLVGSADPTATVDVFKNAACSGVPAVNDAPAAELNGAGISVPVADNTFTQFSVTARSDERTSRCSNSVSYTELTPPAPPPPPSPPRPGADVAPIVSGFVVSPRRVRVGAGASFRFRVSERAGARILIERRLPGRRARFRRVATLTFKNRPAGQNRISFRARRYKRGTHRATIVATDGTGKRSTPKRASFTVLRRR